jgi:WD40 repeat protein
MIEDHRRLEEARTWHRLKQTGWSNIFENWLRPKAAAFRIANCSSALRSNAKRQPLKSWSNGMDRWCCAFASECCGILIWLSAGQKAASGIVPAQVARLVQEVTRVLTWTKLKLAGALVLLVSVCVAGASTLAWRPAQINDELTQPSETKVEAEQVRTDAHGDPLPSGALARLGTVRFRHASAVNAMAFSSDGKILVSAGSTTRLWDVDTGKELGHLRSQHATIFSVAISPDAKIIAEIGTTPTSTSDDVIHLRNATTGHEIGRLPGDQNLDGVNGKKLKPVPKALSIVRFAPDGKSLASASNPSHGIGRTIAERAGIVRLWDLATQKELRAFQCDAGPVRSLQFASNGTLLAWAGDYPRLVLHDVEKGKELASFTLPQREYYGAGALSPDGKIVALGRENPSTDAFGNSEFRPTIELRDFASGRLLWQIPAHTTSVSSLLFSPDGKKLAWTGGQRLVRICDTATGKLLVPRDGHAAEINYVHFTPDGTQLVSGSLDRTARVWDVATQKELRRIETGQGYFETIALSPDGKSLAAPRGPRLWEVASGKEQSQFGQQQQAIHHVAFSPDGRTLAAQGKDRAIHIWEVATGGELRHFGEQLPAETPLVALAFSPDAKILATTNDHGTMRASGKINLWDPATGDEIRSFDLPHRMVSFLSLGFSPDGKLLVTASRGTQDTGMHLWKVETGEEVGPFDRQGGPFFPVQAVVFSPDGKFLASAEGDNAVRFWEESTVRLWDVATRQEIHRWTGHRGRVLSLAFSPDGKKLASGAGDTTVLVWDVMNRR